jgi:hypothetical protein
VPQGNSLCSYLEQIKMFFFLQNLLAGLVPLGGGRM